MRLIAGPGWYAMRRDNYSTIIKGAHCLNVNISRTQNWYLQQHNWITLGSCPTVGSCSLILYIYSTFMHLQGRTGASCMYVLYKATRIGMHVDYIILPPQSFEGNGIFISSSDIANRVGKVNGIQTILPIHATGL